jgi:pimeloyl-ACP methyl ester carboxylesterase
MITKYLKLADGQLAYDDTGGDGPLVMMFPGLGDVRQEYRFMVPQLTAAGYRVVTVDLRGHGESSTHWSEYSLAAIGQDMLTLIDHLDAGPAILVATSYPTGAAIWAAAEKPSAVRGLVLIGAFVRDQPLPAWKKAVMMLLLSGPWRLRTWDMFYNSLYPSRKPDDFADYRRRLRTNLQESGRFEALKAMANEPRDDAERRLDRIQTPVLVMMGSQDPDFADPVEEANFIAASVSGRVAIIKEAGHYPHAEMPEQTLPVLLEFLMEVAPEWQVDAV